MSTSIPPVLSLVGVLVMSAPALASGAAGCEIDKLLASDADELDGYGEHISVRGDVAAVGAWNDEDRTKPIGGFSFGSAYVLRRIDGVWTEEQKLLPSDSESEKRFGHDVAIDGDSIIVGAVGASAYAGEAYFYTRTDGVWGSEQKVHPVPRVPADEFGFAVGIDGDVAIVGSPRDDEARGTNSDAGAAFIYRNVGGTWVEEDKLMASDADFDDYFGWAVAIRGDTAFVSSRVDDDGAVSTGSVWVFRYEEGTWREVQKLHASDASFGDLFGHALALGDGIAVVTALHDDDACPEDLLCNSGSAYVFRFDGERWNEETKLTASDGAEKDEYGNAVSVSGDVVIVGARWTDDACKDDPDCESGSAYVYRREDGAWSEVAHLIASDTTRTDYFGVDVAVDGDEALVGSYLDDDEGTACGAVYVYGVSAGACVCAGDIDGSGTVDTADLLQLLAAWGPCPDCPEDVDDDGDVDAADLLVLLASWGPCA
jgi:hypothetical protein